MPIAVGAGVQRLARPSGRDVPFLKIRQPPAGVAFRLWGGFDVGPLFDTPDHVAFPVPVPGIQAGHLAQRVRPYRGTEPTYGENGLFGIVGGRITVFAPRLQAVAM